MTDTKEELITCPKCGAKYSDILCTIRCPFCGEPKEQPECTCAIGGKATCEYHGSYRALHQEWTDAGAKAIEGQPEKQGEGDIELQRKFSLYKQAIQQQISFRDNKISELESELSAAQQRITELERDLERATNYIGRLEKSIGKLEEELSDIERGNPD